MHQPEPRAQAGPASAEGFHIHVETGRGRGALSTVLAIPERPIGALAAALQKLHDPRGAADLDARLGDLAAGAPAGAAFVVARDGQAWVFPSELLAITRRRAGNEELLTEPQVVALTDGDAVEVRMPGAPEPVARLCFGVAPALENAPAGPTSVVPVRVAEPDISPERPRFLAEEDLADPETAAGSAGAEETPVQGELHLVAGDDAADDGEGEPPFVPDTGFHRTDDLEPSGYEDERPGRRVVIPLAVLGLLVAAAGVGLWSRDRGEPPAVAARTDAFVPPEARSTEPPEPTAGEDAGAAAAPAETAGEEKGAPAAEGLPWTFVARGAITSSPVLVDGRVVFGCRDSTLYCLTADTGKESWAYRAGAGIGSSPSPRDGRVYVGTYAGDLLAVNLEDGSEAWTARTGGKIVSSPCVVGDVVVVGSYDRQIHGFDRETGEPKWARATGSAVRASPEPVAENRIVVGSADGSLYCVDTYDGSVVWKYRAESPVLSAAAYDAARDLVVVGAQDGMVHALAGETGELVWKVPVGSEVNGQPRFAGDSVLLGTGGGRLAALDPATGDERWRATAERGFDARPLSRDGTVIAPSFDGTIHFLALEDGKPLGERKLDQAVFSSPAAGGELVYVGTLGGEFHALRLP